MICIKKILFVILLFPILAFAQSVNCTFSVNMQNEIVSQNGVFIVGTMQGWSLSVNPLDDSDGDGIWSTTLSLDTNSYYEFKYVNGVTWADAEVFGGNCIANSGNRFLNTIDSDLILYPVLFDSCQVTNIGCTDSLAINYDSTALVDDSSCNYIVSVEFNVDMRNENISSAGVHISGTFNNWQTNTLQMFDNNGDSIYTIVVSLNQNTYYEYKFINGNSWGNDEYLAFWQNCSNAGNRFLTTDDNSSSVILNPVCYSSCISCQLSGCTDSLAINYDPLAVISDSSCIYPIYGCIDSNSCNYDSSANTDDGSCYNINFSLGNDTSFCASSYLILTIDTFYNSYLWNTLDTSNSISVNLSGNYSVQVIDSNGCIGSDSIHVSLLPLPYIDIGNDTYICEDDSILFDVGNHWNSVIWTNGTFQINSQSIYVSDTGFLNVTVMDSFGCNAFDQIYITPAYPPISNFSIDINGSTVTFIDSSQNGLNYIWDFYCDGTEVDTLKGNVSYTYPIEGFYKPCLIVSNRCGSDTSQMSINIISSLNILTPFKNNVFYNHHYKTIHINNINQSESLSLEIRDINSKFIETYNLKNTSEYIDVSHLKKSIYIVSLRDKETFTHHKLLIY